MEEPKAIEKAVQELESLYVGMQDDSVDLTFKDFASVQQETSSANALAMPLTQEDNESVDFTKSMEAESERKVVDELHGGQPPGAGGSAAVENNRGLRVDVGGEPLEEEEEDGQVQGRKMRPGIPHSNYCALCNSYIRIFRHSRCLVCGRIYCKSCVGKGMGEMTEGRKCLECLGRKYSKKYIARAAEGGVCCMMTSTVKQQELIWAEKGPRKERPRLKSTSQSQGLSPMTPATPISSRCRSPVMAATPMRSFISNSIVPSPKSKSFEQRVT